MNKPLTNRNTQLVTDYGKRRCAVGYVLAGLVLGSNTVDISSMARTVFIPETKRIRKMDRWIHKLNRLVTRRIAKNPAPFF